MNMSVRPSRDEIKQPERPKLRDVMGPGYGVIAAATLVGAVLNFTPLDPIKALFWSAVINGVAAVPIMVMIMLMASRRAVMGQFTLTRWLMGLGWLATR